MTAKKYDKGKPRPDLVIGDFMLALQHMVNVGSYGAFKYDPKNFQKLPDGEERYADAGLRHYIKRKLGEIFDTETGEFHLAHEIWDKVAELYFYLKEREDIEYVLTIRHPSGDYLDYDLIWYSESEPIWWDEESGRRAIWAMMADGATELKIDKRPAGEVEEIWGVVDAEGEAKIEAALKELPDKIREAMTNWDHTCKPRPSQAEEFAKMEQEFGIWNPVLDRWYAGYGTWEKDPGLAIKYDTLAAGSAAMTTSLESIVDQNICDVRALSYEEWVIHKDGEGYLTYEIPARGLVWNKDIDQAICYDQATAREVIEKYPSCIISMRKRNES